MKLIKLFSSLFNLELAQGLFKVINDQAVKLEPRDQSVSPFQLHPGNYRDTAQATPSPQPLSPPMFTHISPSPSPYQQQNNVGNILQNQLQGSRVTPMPSNFLQQPQANQIFTPNILTTPAFASGSSAIWTNNLNGSEATASRAYNFSNNMQTSAIFSQPMAPTPINQNITQNFNIPSEPMTNSSILIDLDNQLLNNLSGDLQSLSFSDFGMDSFSKTGERMQSNSNVPNK